MIRTAIIAIMAMLLLAAGWSLDHKAGELAKMKSRAETAENGWRLEHDEREKERSNTKRLEDQLNEAHTKQAQVADAARRADRSARGLRDYAEHLAAQCSAGPASPAAPGGQAASSPGTLLADMQRRLDEAAGELASYADDLRVSNETCVGLYPVK